MALPTRSDVAIIDALKRLVEPLNRALPGPTEVVLHSLTQAPYPILAIAGTLTGRDVGAPATGLLFQAAAAKDYSTLVGFEAGLPDGRRARITTMIVRNDLDDPLAALCLISDMSMWEPVRDFVAAVLPGGSWPGMPADQPPVDPDAEIFPSDLGELSDRLIDEALATSEVPVELMHKRHKLAVVAHLRAHGFFELRDAVARAADELDVTRYTIYNYLKQLDS